MRTARALSARRAAVLSKCVLLLAVSGIILAVGCTGEHVTRPGDGPDVPLTTTGGEHDYRVYYVEEGDTLSSIGRRTDVPWERIQEVNDCDPRDLEAGQVLLIPMHERQETPDRTGSSATSSWANRGGGSGHVVLDPGHGGRDPGATSPYAPHEKTINLAVARKVARRLRRQGCRVTMTREGDAFVSLDQRASIANRLNADLFVSIHSNASRDRGARGYEVYICDGASPSSRSAARSVRRAMSGVGIRSRGVRRANYDVLVNTEVPAILIELGFLSNRAEADKLTDPGMQSRLADRIARGIRTAL